MRTKVFFDFIHKLFLTLSQDDSGQKDGNLFVKTANFLDLVNSDENRAKAEAEQAAAAAAVLQLQDRTEEATEFKSQTPKTDEIPITAKTTENHLMKTKQKLMNREEVPDKPAYLSLVHDGLSEVRKLKEEAEKLYSQMDTKVIITFANFFLNDFSIETKYCRNLWYHC